MSNDANPVDVNQPKRNRRMAIINGSYGIVALLAVVFAFVKTQECDQKVERLERQMDQIEKESVVAKTVAERTVAEAKRQETMAREFKAELDECRMKSVKR